MRSFFLNAVAVSAVAGLLALVVLLLRPWLHRRYTARLRCAVWWVLAIWLCIPLKFTLPSAPVRVAAPQAMAEQVVVLQRPSQKEAPPQANPENAAAARPQEAPSSAGAAVRPTAEPAREKSLGAGAAPEVKPTETAPAAPLATLSAAEGVTLPLWQLAVLGWAAAALAVLAARLGGYALWRKRTLRWSRPVQDVAMLALADKAAAAAKVRRAVPLYQNPCAACPMAVGLLRPVLLLPEGLPADDQTAMMLVHEYTHLTRGDTVLKALLVLASSLHWFNPAIWLTVHAAGEDLELACDETVLRGRPTRWREAYGRALVAGAAARGALLATHFSAGKKNMMQRLAAVFSKSNKKKGVLMLTALLLTAALAGGLVACGTEELPPKKSEPMPKGAVPIKAADARALEETLWNGMIVLNPVTSEVPQCDTPSELFVMDPAAPLGIFTRTDRLFLDEKEQVGLAVEDGTFEDMPHVQRTTDGGKTWHLADTSQAAVASPRGQYRDCILLYRGGETVVMEYTTGTMATGGTYIYYLMSTDGGETWNCPRLPKPIRQAIHALYRSGLCRSGYHRSPIAPEFYSEARSNARFTKNEDGTLRQIDESYFSTERGGPIYAITDGMAAFGEEDGQKTVTQALGNFFGQEIRLIYRNLSETTSPSENHYAAAGDLLGAAGDTPYGTGVLAELWVGDTALPAEYLYHDPWNGEINTYQSPQLLALPAELQELQHLAAQADPGGKAVELAYNFGLALLNQDAARAAELMMGRDAISAVFDSGARNPFADLTDFVCGGAAVSVDESRPTAPAALTLDIENPGKTGLPAGRHTYCLEYRTPEEAYPAGGGPAGNTVTALAPLEQWQPQNTPAQGAVGVFRSWCTYSGFENGSQLAQDSPNSVLIYLMITGGKSSYTGAELEALAKKLLDIPALALPKTDRTQDEEYWFIGSYNAAADTYTLTDGFDGGMGDVGVAARWREEVQKDGTLRLTRQAYRDGLCMLPWVSIAYTLRGNEDGTWKILSAEEERYSKILPLEEATLNDYEQQNLQAAQSQGTNGGYHLGEQVLETQLEPRQGRIVVQNARCEFYMDAGPVQILPEENTTEIVWRPGGDVTQVSVYVGGQLLHQIDDEGGAAQARAGGLNTEACALLLNRARAAIQTEYQLQGVAAPIEIAAAKAEKPGDQLSDQEVEDIVRTVCKGVSWLNVWQDSWMMDTTAQPVVREYAQMGNGYQSLYWPCLEFAGYDAYQMARDSVLLRDTQADQFPLVLEWEGKACHQYGGGGRGGSMRILPETIEVARREAGRLDVIIGERQYEEEGVPLTQTPHTLTVQDGNWVLDSFYGDYENSNAQEVEEARARYYETQGVNNMTTEDFQQIWGAMGMDTMSRCWALADDGAWAASGKEKLNFVQREDDSAQRYLKVESSAGTALYRLQEGVKNQDGSSRMTFLSKELNGQSTWYEKGKRPVLVLDLGEPGDNLAELEWTTEEKETGRRQSYFYYKPEELEHKEQRTQE